MKNENLKEICDNFSLLQAGFTKALLGANNNEIDIEALNEMEKAIQALKKLK